MKDLDVKKGDKVVCIYKFKRYLATVTEVTFNGIIKIDFNDFEFDRYGISTLPMDAQYRRPWIHEATPEDIKTFEKKGMLRK